MKIHSETIEVGTQGKGTMEITDQVTNILLKSGVREGQVTVFICHTSASLIIYENADRSARVDLHRFFEELVPEKTPWFTHVLEGDDDMPSHLRMVLTRTSETIPVHQGRMMLGTWQGIFLFEHRAAAHRRNVVVSMIGQ